MGTDNNMDSLKLKKWDSAVHLQSEADIVAYLQACFEEAPEDAAFLAKSLGVVARARGMTQIAKDVGLGRESLYKALSGDNNPSFATMLKVMSALGVKLQVVAS
jgi:probable addiction module antidote protein